MNAGGSGEDAVERLLAAAGLRCRRSSGRFLGWDLLSSVNGVPFTVEVKHDLKEARTGNVALEFQNTKSGEPSGIAATTADLWAHVLRPGRVFLGRVRDLKEFVERNRPLRTVSGAGDDNAAIHLYRAADVCGPVLRDTAGLSGPSLLSLVEELLS